MLCITRKSQQSFVIGEGIEVKVLEIRGDKVRIGITAPKDVDILRTEIVPQYRTDQQADQHDDEKL